MHLWSNTAKQLESVPFQSYVSAYLTNDDKVKEEEKEEEELRNLGINKIIQPKCRNIRAPIVSTEQFLVEHKILAYLRNSGIDHVVVKNLTLNNKGDYFFDSTRKILYFLTTKTISQWILTKYNKYSVQVVNKRDFKCFIVRPKMQSQGIFDALTGMFSNIQNTSHFLIKAVRNYKNPQVLAWVMDILTLTMELNDPFFWRPISLLKFIARLYSAMMRFTDFKNNNSIMHTQSLEDMTGVDSIMLVLTCFGLPDNIMRSLKNISLLTSKKILDSPNIIMDLVQKFLELCYDLLVWIKSTLQLEFITSIIDLLAKPLSFIKGVKLTSRLSKITIDFQKNNQIIFDPVVRVECIDLHKEILSNNYIQSLLTNPLYKIYLQQFSTLQVMKKLASNFDTSARNEPVCIVFEGKAGSGKSTLMNKIVDYLVRKQFSVYNHSCPSIDAAKDFYDDYLDQDIFVMDDVGQQGVSQWRQIINFVSPVKFPLDCAEAKLKNTKFFNSKLLLITTNHFSDLHTFTKTDCIAEPAALFRRCHVLNFDETSFINGRMTGKVRYKKFDHVKEKWEFKFIGLQSDCILQPFCELESNNKTVAWAYSMIKIFLDKQAEMFNNNALTDADSNEIDTLVEEFITLPEEVLPFEDALDDGLNAQSCFSTLADLTNENLEIFKEYFSFLKEHFYEKTKEIYTFLLTGDKSTVMENVLTGILKGTFSTLVTIGAHKLYNYLVGDIAPSELTVNTFRQQSVRLWQVTHGEYIRNTLPSAIIDSSNDTLNDLVHQDTDVSTRISSVRSKMRIIETISKTGFKNVAQGIVSGRRILVQCHSYNSMEGVVNVFRDWNCYSNNSYELNNNPFKVIKEWPEYDMSILEITLPVPLYKDATHSLFTKDIEADSPFSARNMFFINAQAALSLDNNFTVNLDSFQVQSPVLNRTYTVQPGTGIQYRISAAGLCGSLLVDAEHGLCGVHVAGSDNMGFAFVLPKRILKELKSLLTFKESIHLDIKENVEENYSGLKLFNDVFPSKRPLQNSTLNKSELFTVLTEEALTYGEKVPPNFKKFGAKTLPEIAKKSLKPIPYIQDAAIKFGKQCMRRYFVKFNDLSDLEVIKGLKEDSLSGLNKLSVNGFGYDNDKTLYIDFDEGKITSLFSEKLKNFILDCKNDDTKIENLLFYEAFKDELRLVEKKDKPRSFRVAPLHHTFLVKKYIGKLFSHCKKNMWENQIAIGMNPYRDWNKLYKRLKKSSINFDGDFGNWDGGAPAQVQDAISELVMEFYTGSEPEVLQVLLDSMVRTFVLIKEKVVLTTHSMPSGCWVTAFFNSLINRFLTAMVLYTEMEKDGLVATETDFDNLVDFVLGDDKICGAPEHLSKYFNALTVRDFATSIGMKYTDGEKGEITEPSKMLADCVFLKRGFKWHKEMETVVGPLSLNTLVNSLRYKDSSRDYDDIMGGKLTAFQFEIFLHENPFLKNKVLNAAEASSFYFKLFDDEHIKKTMKEEDTYCEVMRCLGKNISNFL